MNYEHLKIKNIWTKFEKIPMKEKKKEKKSKLVIALKKKIKRKTYDNAWSVQKK